MKKTKGFTLIEIMIVIGIIAVLAAVAIPNVLNAYLATKQTIARATLKTISTSLEHYFLNKGNYPSNTTALTSAVPPYLSVDYFTGTHNSYNYSDELAGYSYTITATPVATLIGATSYTMSTGGVLSP